ncbi:MAG: EF-P beta-lysylation protein EpmB [Pseudomonadales bacterium]|nr:EF-P beta-lysylation protein EpmB [Pseudomonadales bacterium]
MITPNRTPWQSDDWQKLLRGAFRQPQELLNHLNLPTDSLALDPQPDFAMLVPGPFAARMNCADPNDPLLRQVLPVLQEREHSAGFVADPLGENDAQLGFKRAPTLIQKYQGRVLMITTPGCAVNCRYCFRRHFPYQDHKPAGHREALAVIAADASISEVILSGGDPLLLGDAQLAELLYDINAIAHVRRIRLHSRLPIVLPQRITEALLATLAASRCSVTVVVHSNHAQELDADTARAFACLRGAGVHLLNQSVLLHGVNDDVDALCALSEALFEQGALPYYLHMPDPVTGTAHFMVSDAQAQPIYEAMRERLPGYLLPRLVREEPGEISKTPLVVQG